LFSDDNCGFSVAVSAQRFAFACPGKNARVGALTRTDAGVVYVYTVSPAGTIAYEANLTHSVSLGSFDRLGGNIDAMSMSGNTLVVGMTGYESASKLASLLGLLPTLAAALVQTMMPTIESFRMFPELAPYMSSSPNTRPMLRLSPNRTLLLASHARTAL
jgi:hypothetical protein